MATIRFVVECIPPAEFAMLVRTVGGGSLTQLLTHVIDFGAVIAPVLARGGKIASGNDMRGYHPVDITLFKKIKYVTNLGQRMECDIPDVPTHTKLVRASLYLTTRTPDAAIPRLMYWFSRASYESWMHFPLYIMDHQRESWREFRFAPLLAARKTLEY